MGNKNLTKINTQPVKQLLNFADRECVPYDISQIYQSLLAIIGGDSSRLVNIELYVDLLNKSEIIKFINQSGKKDAIEKRIRMAVHSLITRQRNNKYYEIEYTQRHEGIECKVGALKFHSQENVRIIAREYNNGRNIAVVMVEGFKKKVQKNSGKYQNRLEAASKIRYYYIAPPKKERIYL
jgi:hypothetical protein